MKLQGSAEAIEDTKHPHYNKICFLDPSMHKSAAVIDASKFWGQVWYPHGELKKLLDPDEAEYTKPKSDWDAVEVPQEANLTVKKI